FAAQAAQLFAGGYVTDANGSTLFSRIALTGIIHVLRTAQCDSLAVRGEGHRNHPGAVRAWRRYAHDFLAGRDFPDAKNLGTIMRSQTPAIGRESNVGGSPSKR